MKTTEQLIKEGAEYFNKCGKHLFIVTHPNGKKEYKHVCLMTKDGVDYRVKMLFRGDSSEASVDMIRMDRWVTPKAEYSQEYFSRWHPSGAAEIKAVRQNKYLRKVLDEIKENILKDKTELGSYNNRLYIKFSPITEKSGS